MIHCRMFVTPLYCGAVVVPGLLMNRRRNEDEVRRTCLGTFEVSMYCQSRVPHFSL